MLIFVPNGRIILFCVHKNFLFLKYKNIRKFLFTQKRGAKGGTGA
jgi:hypothetical protein